MKPIKTFIKPTVISTDNAYYKMKALVGEADEEIGWHGLVEHDEKTNTYIVTEIMVYPQKVTKVSINPDQKEFEEWMDVYRKDWDFPLEKLRLHGHSHVNMKTFSSTTDDKLQEDLLANLAKNDFYLFLILNKQEDMFVRLYDTTHNVVL